MKDRHPGCVLALAAAAAVLLAGCGVPSASEGGDDSSFPRSQAMVVVASERSRYERRIPMPFGTRCWRMEPPLKPICWNRSRDF